MSQDDTHASLSIMNISTVVTDLFTRAGLPLTGGDTKTPARLFVHYLRRKPGRGLAIIYDVDTEKAGKKKRVHDLNHSLSLTIDEQVLEGSRIRFTEAQARHVAVVIQPSGALRAETLGLSAQVFPTDDRLPTLAQSCDVTAQSELLQDLQAAARQQLGSQEWQIISATVIPVRYKPASRCVLRYKLKLERPTETVPAHRDVTIFGKVYADQQQAHAVQALQQRLYQEQIAKRSSKIGGHSVDVPLLPQPFGINETLGLTLNEAVQPANAEKPLRLGGHVLRPHIVYGRGGEVKDVVIPTEELQLTAIALARLHTSAVHLDEGLLRTGIKEAKRTQDRARLIAVANPGQAEDVQKLAQLLASRLEKQRPDVYRPAHGGFKASQLLFHSDSVFVVDFDGFCLADSALDVGYFLAYLRPSGLWYARPGMRQWFEAAAHVFSSTYKQAMIELGVTSTSIDGILERTKFYEAVLLFKIATRRVNRLNSPRPQELSAMLREIATCLHHEPGRA
ncbi:MAG: hypothetical protein NVS4B1_13750 [Ktedonobacteraceae bacterium]